MRQSARVFCTAHAFLQGEEEKKELVEAATPEDEEVAEDEEELAPAEEELQDDGPPVSGDLEKEQEEVQEMEGEEDENQKNDGQDRFTVDFVYAKVSLTSPTKGGRTLRKFIKVFFVKELTGCTQIHIEARCAVGLTQAEVTMILDAIHRGDYTVLHQTTLDE